MKHPKKLVKYNNASFDKIDAKESDYLYVTESQILGAGKGLFTSIPIYKDEIISLFRGKILTDNEASSRAKNGKDRYFISMLDGTIMDSMHAKCFAKYSNDAEGIVKSKFKANSTISLNDQDQVCLIAIRDLTSGEEVFCSYGKKYWKKHSK